MKWKHRECARIFTFEDGDQLLVALPSKCGKFFHYDIVTARADDGDFKLFKDGETWNCDWDDVSYFSCIQPPERISKKS